MGTEMKTSKTNGNSNYRVNEICCIRSATGIAILGNPYGLQAELPAYDLAKWILSETLCLNAEAAKKGLCLRLTDEILTTMPMGVECHIPLAEILNWLERERTDEEDCTYKSKRCDIELRRVGHH